MNIQILDSWLREFLDTSASSKEIAKYLSLCGPSVEKVITKGNDFIYDIEVTTNRVDLMSVYGIAREAAAILPQFGIQAKLKKLNFKPPKPPTLSLPLIVKIDKNLVRRIMGVVIEDITNWVSPDWMKQRLEASGIRSLNSVIDITNYVMVELGHPMHAFDYDKIPNATLIVRESKRGEKITTLDNKDYQLPGGDIVFQSTRGEIIDLPGIIGTKNSVVSYDTKRVLLFIDNNDPVRIRRTSMSLAIRTVAATVNEKNVDPELGLPAILRAIDLAKSVALAKVASKIYDDYPLPIKHTSVETSHNFIKESLGIDIDKNKIASILQSLEFNPKWSQDNLIVSVPSHRAYDVEIPEDIVEEVARIYGYHNLPSKLMAGEIPDPLYDSPFEFENKLKDIIISLGGIETYTLSLVSEKDSGKNALKLKNPLGADTEYLRTSLQPSLVNAALENKRTDECFHLFEIANVYIAKHQELPDEINTLAGIFSGYSFREAKGIVECLLDSLHISYKFKEEDAKGFSPSRRVVVVVNNENVGEFGELEQNFFYYEFGVEKLRKVYSSYPSFIPIPKYPPQIEDLTLRLPEKTKVSDIIHSIKSIDKKVTRVELTDIFRDSYTFRIWYQAPEKTLTNEEVEEIRKKILKVLKNNFGVTIKE